MSPVAAGLRLVLRYGLQHIQSGPICSAAASSAGVSTLAAILRRWENMGENSEDQALIPAASRNFNLSELPKHLEDTAKVMCHCYKIGCRTSLAQIIAALAPLTPLQDTLTVSGSPSLSCHCSPPWLRNLANVQLSLQLPCVSAPLPAYSLPIYGDHSTKTYTFNWLATRTDSPLFVY
jgi:hypothetical protein